MDKVSATQVTRLLLVPPDFIHRVSPQQRPTFALTRGCTRQPCLAGAFGPQFDRRSNSIPLKFFICIRSSEPCGGEVEQTQPGPQISQTIAGLFKLSTAPWGQVGKAGALGPSFGHGLDRAFRAVPKSPPEAGTQRSLPVRALAERGFQWEPQPRPRSGQPKAGLNAEVFVPATGPVVSS